MNARQLYMGSIAGPLGPATPFNGYLTDHPKGLTFVDTGFGTTLALIGGRDVHDPDAVTGELVFGELQLGEEGLELWRQLATKLQRLPPDEVQFAHDTNFKHAR